MVTTTGNTPYPFVQDEIADYVWEKHQDGMTYTGLSSFVEAVHFGTQVLGLPVANPEIPTVSTFDPFLGLKEDKLDRSQSQK